MRHAANIIAAVIAAVLVSGCRTKSVTVPEYHTRDSVQIRHVRDSLSFHDSVYVSVSARNDTVIKEVCRWRYAYRDRLVRDTVTVARRDSVPYMVEKRVPEYVYRTRWYDKVCRRFTLAVAVCVALALLAWYVRNRKG